MKLSKDENIFRYAFSANLPGSTTQIKVNLKYTHIPKLMTNQYRTRKFIYFNHLFCQCEDTNIRKINYFIQKHF